MKVEFIPSHHYNMPNCAIPALRTTRDWCKKIRTGIFTRICRHELRPKNTSAFFCISLYVIFVIFILQVIVLGTILHAQNDMERGQLTKGVAKKGLTCAHASWQSTFLCQCRDNDWISYYIESFYFCQIPPFKLFEINIKICQNPPHK